MKKIIAITMCVFFAMTAMRLWAQNQSESGKILVAYFSMPESGGVDTVSGASRLAVNGTVTGNVEFVANIIQRTTGGDLFAIRTVRTYPGGQALREAAQNERDTNARPSLSSHIPNLQTYDTIFLGYPIWWYDLPMPINSFLDEYDFAGKTIIPFTVHSGSGFLDTIEKIIAQERQATVVRDGFAVSRNNVSRSERDVTAWLRRIGVVR